MGLLDASTGPYGKKDDSPKVDTLTRLAQAGKQWLEDNGFLGQPAGADVGPPRWAMNPPGASQQPAIMQNRAGNEGARYSEAESRMMLHPPPARGMYGNPDQRFVGPPGPDDTEPTRFERGAPIESARLGGDSYTKTPEQWAAMFAKQRELPPTLPPDSTQTPSKKPQGGGDKPTAPGADPRKTGTVTNPTSAMEDDSDLAEFRKLIDRYESKPTMMNLKPLMALTDAWTGSNLAASYQAPESAEERDKNVMSLRERQFEKEAGLKYKKAYLAQQAEEAKAREAFQRDKMAQDYKLGIAKVGAMGAKREAAAADPAKAAKARQTASAQLLRTYGKAIDALAMTRHGLGPDGKPDPQKNALVVTKKHEVVNDVLDLAEELERSGAAPPGHGISQALSFFQRNGAAGPDSARGS